LRSNGIFQTWSQDHSAQNEITLEAEKKAFVCPYHMRIFENPMSNESRGRGLAPLQRFLAEESPDTNAFLCRPDNNEMSTEKGCLCGVNIVAKDALFRDSGDGRALKDKGLIWKL
jgi:hypothetical protein